MASRTSDPAEQAIMNPSHVAAGVSYTRLLVAWLLVLPAIALAAEPKKVPPAGDSSACELILEGKHIKKLVLKDEQGQTKGIARPGPKVLLPAGRYQVEEVELEGGFSGRFFYPQLSLTLNHDQPCRPNIGAPLTPTVKVKRSGRLLTFDYQLLDADGRNYTDRSRSHPPKFAVYQGDQQIGSGTFEYG
jgi:hypothetical protein